MNWIFELVDFLVFCDICVVFVEIFVFDCLMCVVIEGVVVKGYIVFIGGEFFFDVMGQDGIYEGIYIGMIDYNVMVIINVLGGDVFLCGLNNKLSVGF